MTTHIEPEALSAYLLGESPSAVAANIESHLAVCADCRRQQAEMRGLIGAFAKAEARRPRADILDALLTEQRRNRVSAGRRVWRGGLWAAGTAAAVLAVFTAGFWAGRHTSPEARTTEASAVVRRVSGDGRRRDLAAPPVMFVAAIPDRVAGLAKQDTTAN